MAGFAESMAVLAGFTDTMMGMPWTWRDGGEELEVRDAFHRSLELELRQLAKILGTTHLTEPAIAMMEVDRAFGDLRGLLAGQPDDLLDVVPIPGEWPLREVLHHLLEVELSYRLMVRWAVERDASDPLRPSAEQRQRESTAPADGTVAQIGERHAAARLATDEFVETLSPAQLELPTVWSGHEVDVRFRLYRFVAHTREHTIQVEKVLHALDRDPAEARQVVRMLWSARDAHARRSTLADLERLDAELARVAGQVREIAGL
jgi:hypothetical protein